LDLAATEVVAAQVCMAATEVVVVQASMADSVVVDKEVMVYAAVA